MIKRSAVWVMAAMTTIVQGRGQADTLVERYARSIEAGQLESHLKVLASDSFEGRDTGKKGQKMAAAYLKEQFQQMGIPPVPAAFAQEVVDGYFQPYQLIEEYPGGLSLVQEERTFDLRSGLVYFNVVLNESFEVRELLYLGDGTDLDLDQDLSGRVVLINGNRMGQGEEVMGPLRHRVDQVRKMKPLLILVSTPYVKGLEGFLHGGTHMRLADGNAKSAGDRNGQLVLVDEAAMNALLGRNSLRKLARKKPGRIVPVAFTVRISPKEESVTAENVLAYIEGGDRKDELVVITAHYDHIGVENGVVYNGADDDGSGTVALLEIAEALAKAKVAGHGPRRSVLIMPVSGEEKGLLGSRYYSEHPVFPISSTVADLNIDMIGRVDSAHGSSPPYVYVIGSDRLSSELHAVNEMANARVGLVLDYAFNSESDPNRFYYRSDHYNFARKGIPSIFYFSGVHEDYHQPGDDVEKIRFDLLRQRAELVFRTAWEIANREQRLVVDKPAK